MAFFIPQEIPLEYFPLNNPSSGLQYLEITCSANTKDTTEIFLDTGRGFNAIEKIQWLIGPSSTPYTYTFPLPDAPLYRLRLVPFVNSSGEFTITGFRIINRRAQEVRRFSKDSFIASRDIGIVVFPAGGWKLVTLRREKAPEIDLLFNPSLRAEGMNVRNLQRCLRSTSYLGLMLWIILLSVYFAFRQQQPTLGTLKIVAFLLFLSVCFSFVGNRGLIRNSLRFWLSSDQSQNSLTPSLNRH